MIDVLPLRISSSSSAHDQHCAKTRASLVMCRTSCCEKVKVWCCVNSPTIVQFQSNSVSHGLMQNSALWRWCSIFSRSQPAALANDSLSDARNNWKYKLIIGNVLLMCGAQDNCNDYDNDGDDREKREFSFYFSVFPYISPLPHFLMTLDSFQYHHQQRARCNFHTAEMHLERS